MKPLLRNSLFWKLFLLLVAIALFAFSFIYDKVYTGPSSVAEQVRIAEKYLHHQQKDFTNFLKDTSLVRKLVTNTESIDEFEKIVKKKYGIFLYTVSNQGTLYMNFWSSKLILPPPETYSFGNMEEFMHLSNGDYLVIKKIINLSSRILIAYAIIPIQSSFFLETEYFPKKFVYSNTANQLVVMSDKPTAFPVRSLSGKTLFWFDKKTTGAIPYNSNLIIILRFTGLFIFLLFIHLIAESLTRKKTWKGILFLSLSLLTIRLAIYFFPFLLNLRQFELFDPMVYGSNIVQKSLGDLLLNSFFFCWIVLFAWYKVQNVKNNINGVHPFIKWPAGVISLCLLIYSTFILSSVIRSMVADSKISFDVTNFESLDQYTAVGFIVLACLSLSYYYFTQLLFRIIQPLFRNNTWAVYFAIGFSGLVYLTIKSGDPTVLFYLPVLAWLLLYTWLVNREGMILTRIRINIAGILFWIFVFSVSISIIMLAENKKAEWNRRKFYAEKVDVQTDRSSERLLNIAFEYLDKDFFQENFHRFTDSIQNLQLRDSILSGNYSEYVNNYDTRLLVYDAEGKPLYNKDPNTFEALTTLIKMQAQPTKKAGRYYYEPGLDNFMYITRLEAKNETDSTIGFLFILSLPKNYGSGELFPELFKQVRKNNPENSPIYSYAVYNNGKLTAPYTSKYPFPTRIDNKKFADEFSRKISGEYDELWYQAGNDKVVVMVRERDTSIEAITLFSYIFCSFLFLVFFVQLLSLFLKAVSDWKAFKDFFHFNIRNQVHSTIIFISIFCFIVIGIATISFFKSRYNRNNSDKLSRTMKIMVNEMGKRIANYDIFNNADPSSYSLSDYNLQQLVKDVSDIHGVDVNVYNLKGDLFVSSADSTVYIKGVLSRKIDPTAFYHLNRLKQVEHVQNENVSDLSYVSIYAPVRDKDGVEYAYLSIPYFTSQSDLNQEISNFIVTIINLNAFIFLVAGLIALFITNRITRSFSIISNKMKEVNLGKLNEEIEWSRNDEIGDLVKEYNKMVAKLEASAGALAKTEREGAWREMARQVAHEIKNPLTPMKLSMQYLQKAIDTNQPNVKELSGNVAHTLIEQIDHLSKIAADFSQFANIGNTNVETFDLHDVIRSLYELYRSDGRINFTWRPLHKKVFINADKTQMNRLFTNLFANAVEACNNGNCSIEVSEQGFEDKIRISIKDNGEGIAPEMQSRIFIPNFTTKSSGTGLGLAMCKGIVEQAKGTIWFETEPGKGTTFYVELPVVES